MSASPCPKVPFYGRRPTSRTTTGCLTCRQRRLKCDETKPSCERCTRGQLECTYGVQIRWPRQGAKPGNNRTRKSKSRKEPCPVSYPCETDPEDVLQLAYRVATPPPHDPHPQPSPDAVLLWNPSDLDSSVLQNDHITALAKTAFQTGTPNRSSHYRGFDTSDGSASLDLGLPNMSLMLFPATSINYIYPLPDMKSEEKMLFNFYTCKMCPKCMVRNGDNNTYREVVLPLVHQSPLLLQGVLAVAASSMKLHDTRFHTAALRHQTAALRGLQQSITTKTTSSFSRLESLSLILMLCFFEIYSPGTSVTNADGVPVRPWRAHSQGVRNLFEQELLAKSHDPHYEKAILSFLCQYFASRSVLTYTTMSHHEDQQGILHDATYWLALVDRPRTEINPFAGCSNELLDLIVAITSQLRRQQLSPISGLGAQWEWVDEMERQLQNIDQFPPLKPSHDFFNSPRGDSVTEMASEDSVENTAEAFRLAALILLENIRRDLDDTADDTQTVDYVDQIFHLLESGVSIPPCGKLGSSSYLWPYFIAGCQMRCPQQQAAMLNHMRRLIAGNGADSWPRNAMAEQIQHILIHVWLITSRSDGTMTALVEENGMRTFVWESCMLSSRYVFEWI